MRAIHPDADDRAVRIGAKLRAARTAQGMTLMQLSQTTGLSKGFLSRVERDETSPSVTTLVQICQVLSLPLGSLFAEPAVQVVRFADAPNVQLGGLHAEERLLSPRSEGRLQLLHSRLAPDSHGGEELYTINCDVEVMHVLRGAVRVRFASHDVVVATGDAVTFPGREPHTWSVEGGVEAEIIWVLVPALWHDMIETPVTAQP